VAAGVTYASKSWIHKKIRIIIGEMVVLSARNQDITGVLKARTPCQSHDKNPPDIKIVLGRVCSD